MPVPYGRWAARVERQSGPKEGPATGVAGAGQNAGVGGNQAGMLLSRKTASIGKATILAKSPHQLQTVCATGA